MDPLITQALAENVNLKKSNFTLYKIERLLYEYAVSQMLIFSDDENTGEVPLNDQLDRTT